MKTNSFFKALFFIGIFGGSIYSQNKIEYTYDKTGNRTVRKLYVCPNCPAGGRMASAQPTPQDSTQVIATQHGLNIFPNPTQDKINLNLSNLKDDETAEVVVTDETGKTLYNAKNLQSENQINMASYNNGTYFVRVTMGKDVVVYKVMKLQ